MKKFYDECVLKALRSALLMFTNRPLIVENSPGFIIFNNLMQWKAVIEGANRRCSASNISIKFISFILRDNRQLLLNILEEYRCVSIIAQKKNRFITRLLLVLVTIKEYTLPHTMRHQTTSYKNSTQRRQSLSWLASM